jgi:hypothetical protein
MKELSAYDIAAALTGRPGDPGPELRLLMLFQSEARHLVDVELESVRDALPKAA